MVSGSSTILLHKGLVHKPKTEDYWSMKPCMQCVFAPKVMPRNKFMRILAMLHVANNSNLIPQGEQGSKCSKSGPSTTNCAPISGTPTFLTKTSVWMRRCAPGEEHPHSGCT
ncbi:hypothetical protein ACOMHN_051637 [Nucella lapillus]